MFRNSLIASVILMVLLITPASAQTACSNPGAGNTTNYAWDSAANTYVVCNILSAQATAMALPTPTPDAVGCSPDGSNGYRICENLDTSVRVDARGVYWQPVIAFALIAGFALMIRRNSTI